MLRAIHIFETYHTSVREQRVRHSFLLIISIIFSWILWTLVNLPVYRTLSGRNLTLEIAKDFGEHVVEITLLMELSLLYSRLIISAFWNSEKNVLNLIVQVLILAAFNGLAAFGMATLYQAISPNQDGLFMRILFTDYVDLSVLSTAVFVFFLNNRYSQEQHARILAEKKEQEEQLILLRARLQNLSLQTDNHFVFNCFSTLSELIYESPNDAVRFLNDFIAAYRYLLRYSDKDLVPLREEIVFVRDYARVLNYRHPGVSVEVDPSLEVDDRLVCPVTLQSLVENAVKHNRHGEKDLLCIRLNRQDDNVIIINNILPLFAPTPSTGKGLAVLKEKYRLVARRELTIEQDNNFFCVTVPLIKMIDCEDEGMDY